MGRRSWLHKSQQRRHKPAVPREEAGESLQAQPDLAWWVLTSDLSPPKSPAPPQGSGRLELP